MRPNRFYDVIRIGPVKVSTFNNGRSRTRHRGLHCSELRFLHRASGPLGCRTRGPHPPLHRLSREG